MHFWNPPLHLKLVAERPPGVIFVGRVFKIPSKCKLTFSRNFKAPLKNTFNNVAHILGTSPLSNGGDKTNKLTQEWTIECAHIYCIYIIILDIIILYIYIYRTLFPVFSNEVLVSSPFKILITIWGAWQFPCLWCTQRQLPCWIAAGVEIHSNVAAGWGQADMLGSKVSILNPELLLHIWNNLWKPTSEYGKICKPEVWLEFDPGFKEFPTIGVQSVVKWSPPILVDEWPWEGRSLQAESGNQENPQIDNRIGCNQSISQSINQSTN